MALLQLQSELDERAGIALMPGRWSIESLISWCREVAKHNAGVLEPSEDDDLFDVVNSFIEKLLLAQDAERHDFYRKNCTSLFDLLAHEVDVIVLNELVARITGYDIDHMSSKELFRNHFPANLRLMTPVHEVDKSYPTAVHTEPAQ